jgi:hypothetical protein
VSQLAESMENQSNELKKCTKRCLEKIKKGKITGSHSNEEISVLMQESAAKFYLIINDNF